MPEFTGRISPLTNKEIVFDIIFSGELSDQVEPFILANRMVRIS